MGIEGICPACQKQRELTKHHLDPQQFAGDISGRNVIMICRECHDIVDSNKVPSEQTLIEMASRPMLLALFTNKVWAHTRVLKLIDEARSEVIKNATKLIANPQDVRKRVEKLKNSLKFLYQLYNAQLKEKGALTHAYEQQQLGDDIPEEFDLLEELLKGNEG